MHDSPLNSIVHHRHCASHAGRRRPGLWGAVALIAILASTDLVAGLSEISFTAGSVEFQGGVAQAVSGHLDLGGQLEIRAESLTLESRAEIIRDFQLACPEGRDNTDNLCPNGAWNLDLQDLHTDRAFSRVQGTIRSLTHANEVFGLSGRVNSAGLESAYLVRNRNGEMQIELEWAEQGIQGFSTLRNMPAQFQWVTRGSSDGHLWLTLSPGATPGLRYTLELNDMAFDSPDGQFAGESVQLESSGTLILGAAIEARLKGRVVSGELLAGDFYRDFSGEPMDFEARPILRATVLEVPDIKLTDNNSLHFQGSASLDLEAAENALTFRISRLDLSFPGAYQRYMEPVVAVWTLNGLDTAGQISWSGEWTDGAFESGELVLKDLTIVDNKRGRFAVTGLDGRLRPGDHDFDSRLAWRGLLLGRVNLGAGESALQSEPGRVALAKPLELDVLGGKLVIDELGIDLPGSMASVEQELDFQLRAELRSLDMEKLTAAMQWPGFSGEISGKIPAVNFNDGVLRVDGEIIVEVFDGHISVSDLSVERLFGVLPSLAATADIHNLDLEQLTRTFSFGQISGRMDGYVHDLRMLDWKPVAFDAWFGTPARQEKSNDISRNAVNHLTELGGGGATAALTGPIMKLFNSFSYRRLGLGCRLHDNVCDLRGISEDDVSVLIMEGAGLPKIMIRAFNRSMDWQQLLGGLIAVTGDEPIKVAR